MFNVGKTGSARGAGGPRPSLVRPHINQASSGRVQLPVRNEVSLSRPRSPRPRHCFSCSQPVSVYCAECKVDFCQQHEKGHQALFNTMHTVIKVNTKTYFAKHDLRCAAHGDKFVDLACRRCSVLLCSECLLSSPKCPANQQSVDSEEGGHDLTRPKTLAIEHQESIKDTEKKVHHTMKIHNNAVEKLKAEFNRAYNDLADRRRVLTDILAKTRYFTNTSQTKMIISLYPKFSRKVEEVIQRLSEHHSGTKFVADDFVTQLAEIWPLDDEPGFNLDTDEETAEVESDNDEPGEKISVSKVKLQKREMADNESKSVCVTLVHLQSGGSPLHAGQYGFKGPRSEGLRVDGNIITITTYRDLVFILTSSVQPSAFWVIHQQNLKKDLANDKRIIHSGPDAIVGPVVCDKFIIFAQVSASTNSRLEILDRQTLVKKALINNTKLVRGKILQLSLNQTDNQLVILNNMKQLLCVKIDVMTNDVGVLEEVWKSELSEPGCCLTIHDETGNILVASSLKGRAMIFNKAGVRIQDIILEDYSDWPIMAMSIYENELAVACGPFILTYEVKMLQNSN